MVFNATLYNISVIAWQSVGGGNPEYPEKSLHYRTNASFGNLDKCFKLLNKIETCTMCIGLTGS
jgi:hypothetical protein